MINEIYGSDISKILNKEHKTVYDGVVLDAKELQTLYDFVRQYEQLKLKHMSLDLALNHIGQDYQRACERADRAEYQLSDLRKKFE